MSNLAADTAATFCATLVDEWFRCGVREAVVCPGSRSTPLALALAHHDGIRLRVRLDERGAGFFGIGLAMAGVDRRPVVVLTTSGTAAAELHAAVVEASYARLPLLVCTADRPPELQQVGAPQTIDQGRLFGGAVRWFFDPGVADEAGRGTWRSLAARAVAEAVSGPKGPGPVHLNLPFREPLLGVAGQLPAGRPGGARWHEVSGRHPAGPTALRAFFGDEVRPGVRGVIVAGGDHHDQADVVGLLADRLGWPVFADPRSGCRLEHGSVIGAADSLLRDEGFVRAHEPEVVLRVGDPWASKVVAGWLWRTAAAGVPHLAVDPDWQWQDAGREIARFWNAPLDPESVEACLPAEGVDGWDGGAWLAGWRAAEAIAQAAISDTLAGEGRATEPGVARALYAWVPDAATIVVSSSMPVRDLEWFGRPRQRAPRVLANRGANGIDGVVSTAFGVAAGLAATAPGAAGGRLYGLVGDLAVLHDASALVRPVGSAAMPAVIVVLDNAGGGIFEFLPQASALTGDEFEQLFGTPQLPAVASLVRGCGYSVTEIDRAEELLPALADADAETTATGEPVFLVVRTDRKANVGVHQAIDAAVAAALAAAREA